ncbi:MAG: M48 family metallopeptidase, partial [Burkholderiales bacterium]
MNKQIIAAVILAAAFSQASHADRLKDTLKDLLNSTKPAQQAPQAEPSNAQAGQQEFKISPLGKVSQEDEVRLGRQIAGNLLGAAPLVKDPKLQQYVNRVGRWVALHSDRPDLKWTFGVIESNDLNAFAAPGGYVFVTRGLYMKLKDEGELAGVLGHEIAHVQQKHHLKVVQKSQLVEIGASILKKKLAKGESAVQKVIGSGAEIMARGLDKDAEFEADRLGVVLAARAGYDAWGLPSVLQEISAVSPGDSSVGLLFKTHPHPDERLARLGDAMGERLDSLKDSGNAKG